MPESGTVAHLFSALRALIHWLNAKQTPHVMIGGLAASLLGRPRVTRDIDAIVWFDEDKLGDFINSGAKFGFFPRISDALAFARNKRVLLVHHQPSHIDVDISLGALPFEKETIQRAKAVKVAGLSVRIPTVEDLIIMKAVAHRPRDLFDIATLLEVHPKADQRRIRKWIREFSRVLETPEILDDFERLTTATKGKGVRVIFSRARLKK